MIIDSLAVLAVLYRESDVERYETAIVAAPHCRMSVADMLEASIIVEGLDDTFLEKAGIELVPVTSEHADAACRSWRRFGKGNHPASPYFGDCFAYALADVAGGGLLFKGDDFPQTTIEQA